MRSLGEGSGLDLTQDTKPPKNLYVEVSLETVFVVEKIIEFLDVKNIEVLLCM